MLAHEGPLAFYKGFGMCWARVSPIAHTSAELVLTDVDFLSWAHTRL